MNYSLYFSPTGQTKRIVDFAANQFENSNSIDISLEIKQYQFNASDFCIVGVPSFAGRVPAIAIERLKSIQGKKTPVLLIVTYGNRAYDDTLLELKETLDNQGFQCIGAMAIVTQHSIVNQYGKGKPTQADWNEIKEYMKTIKERLSSGFALLSVPGNSPYKDVRPSAMHPQTSAQCIQCGLCARKCPVQAISIKDSTIVDDKKCISCMRCVTLCPQHAKVCDENLLQSLAERLQPVCSLEKKNEFF